MVPNRIAIAGPAVDCYLKAQGALAQAVNERTVLLSSSAVCLCRWERQLLLLHEFAHLEQLARPGNDLERLLEEEAWEAAHARQAGKHFQIRGRARGPLNAIAIIQGGDHGHPHAPLWYQTNPVEPIGNQSSITVTDTNLQGRMSLETILDHIIQNKPTDIVLVSHGDNIGLALPLTDGAESGVQKWFIDALSNDRPGPDTDVGGVKVKSPAQSDKDVADYAKLDETKIRTLRQKMNRVKAMKLNHVAFRACNMGESKDTLVSFRTFLGAASVSAPIWFDSYGQFTPSIKANVEAWAEAERKAGFHISIDGNVAFGIRRSAALSYTIVARAASKENFQAWVKLHITDRTAGRTGIVFHGMRVKPADKTAPIIVFVRDQEFIDNIVFNSA